MTIEEIKEHLSRHILYVVERSTSRRGIPSIVSFYILVHTTEVPDGTLEHDYGLLNIDAEIVDLLKRYYYDTEHQAIRLLPVGRVKAASIHDPYIHTLEEHMADLSEALFGDTGKLSWRVI